VATPSNPAVPSLVTLLVDLELDAEGRFALASGSALFDASVEAGVAFPGGQDALGLTLGEAIRRGYAAFRTRGGGVPEVPEGQMWSSRELQSHYDYYPTLAGHQLASLYRQGSAVADFTPSQESETNNQIGPWVIERQLGRGGNADVYAARRSEEEAEVALKVLHATNPNREPYRRFQREIKFVQGLAGREGILPVLDTHLPTNPSPENRAWMSMPIATPLTAALEPASVDVVIDAVATIAETLAELASEHQAGHRDLKPANLYELDGRWLIGDFGLVDAPDHEELTRTSKALGPLHFRAPEMIVDPVNAETLSADVYSMGKTLWALVTQQKFPPPGHQTSESLHYSVSAYIGDPRASHLDRVIDQATRIEADERPSMEQLARELRGVAENKTVKDVRMTVPIDNQQSATAPLELHDEVLDLLRASDAIGLGELLRRERREFSSKLAKTIEGFRQQRPTEELMAEAHDALLPTLERRLATMLPLVSYEEEGFSNEVSTLTDLLEHQPLVGGYRFWPELVDWSTWWLTYTTGALAVKLGRFAAVKSLLTATFSTRNGAIRPLADPVRESAGHDLGAAVMARVDSQKWAIPRYSHLIWSLQQMNLIKERWPELLEPDGEPQDSLDSFDFLITLRSGQSGDAPLAQWSMRDDGATALARRLRRDAPFRAQVAEALGIDPTEFFDRARDALQNQRRPNNTFADSTADQILLAPDP
jgi:serine/threonine protein kinase